MSEFVYPHPHEPIVEDMAWDMAAHMRGMNRRLDRKLRKKEVYFVSDVTYLASNFKRASFQRDLATPQLIPEWQRHEIETGITSAARAVGDLALVRMVEVLDMPPFFYDKNKFLHPETGEKITPNDWTHEVWAPDYGQRFADAAMENIATSVEAPSS